VLGQASMLAAVTLAVALAEVDVLLDAPLALMWCDEHPGP
jgi:hypothetical protein